MTDHANHFIAGTVMPPDKPLSTPKRHRRTREEVNQEQIAKAEKRVNAVKRAITIKCLRQVLSHLEIAKILLQSCEQNDDMCGDMLIIFDNVIGGAKSRIEFLEGQK